MDPEANLKEQLSLAKKIQEQIDADELISQIQDDIKRLAELVLALDGWISKGGFLPERWIR